jgi:Flp pilus assembly protein TadG
MRRMTELDRDRDDRGVATIFLILAMTAILVGAGLAIDVGQYVAAARSAQNSADATVLAVATDCALFGAPIADYSPYRKDGQTITAPVCGSGEATTTVTKEVDGLFLKQSAGAVDRSATARWGTLSGATTLPIVIAACEWAKFPVENSTNIIVHLPDTKKQTGCFSGPGGFGQLDDDDDGDPCSVAVSVPGTASGEPGNAFRDIIPCIPALPADVLIPIFDDAQCPAKDCQGNKLYPIVGFAVFRLTGYSFQQGAGGSLGKNGCDKNIGKNCIRGDFIKTTTSQGTPGPSTNFGVTQIYLSK